jgi:predicted nucleic acid-binding protein
VNRFVLDASVALAWFVDRSIDPYAVDIRERLRGGDRALVPALWRVEVVNGFVMAERRGILISAEIATAVAKLEALQGQSIDSAEGGFSLSRLLGTARKFRLTAYDAEYLETARNEELPLATLDRKLKAAAVQAGIELAR